MAENFCSPPFLVKCTGLIFPGQRRNGRPVRYVSLGVIYIARGGILWIKIIGFYLYSLGRVRIERSAVGAGMTKDKLVEKIKELLKTDNNLDFLLELKKEELERLVACIRDRVDRIIQTETI